MYIHIPPVAPCFQSLLVRTWAQGGHLVREAGFVVGTRARQTRPPSLYGSDGLGFEVAALPLMRYVSREVPHNLWGRPFQWSHARSANDDK